jgi:hypothetical protein
LEIYPEQQPLGIAVIGSIVRRRLIAKQNAYPGVNNMVQARGGWPLGKETLMSHPYKDREGYILKFVRFITKNGKRIYPKSGKVFPIWVKA